MAEEARIDLTTYGRSCTVSQTLEFLTKELEINRENFEKGRRRHVPMIWGPPGIGKTDLVKQFKKLGYVVKHVPLAQFEEMGDLNGIPQEYQDSNGNWVTKTCPPEWVPDLKRDGAKVILLLDDLNRADARILKGTMQLIQDYGLVSWQLDQPDWHMIATANPEGGLNDVSPLDPAQVSRFTHITLRVEGEDGVRAWASWASENEVDDRAITFLLREPKMLFGDTDRRNPRTWTQAFDIMRSIPKGEPGRAIPDKLAQMMGLHIESCIDKDAANAFSVFMTKGILELVDPEDLLDKLETVMPKLKALAPPGKTPRTDCLFAIYERLFLYIKSSRFETKVNDSKTQQRGVNFCRLMSSDDLPGKDMRWAIVRRLLHSDTEETKKKTRELLKEAKVLDKMSVQALTQILADSITV
jgi:hypothetical protein